ncbi:MAG TPA: hemerythrin domain-containing protein [Lacipirellulaceae bacterium]|nr:hemerythrin domain-containing protein [Lacipirellulaceae bacterium]
MYANRTTDVRAVAQASQLEHQILDHVKQALRITLEWKAPAFGLPRKMSSVQFTMRSFARHLQRMMDLEERDGYLAVVLEEKPNMDTRLKRLQREHREFRAQIEALEPEVASLPALPEEKFELVCSQIMELLDRVDQHDVAEIELIQETLLHDEGGEGG